MHDPYGNYLRHFARVAAGPPDWTATEAASVATAPHAPWLPEDPQARILDVGCGLGHHLLELWRAGYRQIEGVELVPEIAAAANAAAGGRVSIHCADARAFLAHTRDTYAVITLFSVLEHLPLTTGIELLRAIYDALIPGGRVFVRVPNMASIVASNNHFGDISHCSGFTEYSIQQVLDQAGYVDHVIVPDACRGMSSRVVRRWLRRRLGLRRRVNTAIHRLLYWAGGVGPWPTTFHPDLDVYSHKRDAASST